jgi:hypothetical protein
VEVIEDGGVGKYGFKVPEVSNPWLNRNEVVKGCAWDDLRQATSFRTREAGESKSNPTASVGKLELGRGLATQSLY